MNNSEMIQLVCLSIELAIIYDVMRVYRGVSRCKAIAIGLLDLVFWAFTIWNMLEYLHGFGNGLLRWYHILVILVVIYLYFTYFSVYFRKMAEFGMKKSVISLTNIKRIVIIKGTKGGHQHGKEKKNSSEVSQ